MSPIFALIVTLLFIAFLFARDYKDGCRPSWALVIPCIWVFLRGSRSATEWFNLGSPPSGIDILDGTPLDRAVTFLLMGLGLIVLLRRGISWTSVFRKNIALVLFFLYCAISITWSDFQFVAFKRWIKLFGDPIMALIILTDRDPLRAVDIVLRAMVNLLIPLSVLFIKYFPHLGRVYSEWTGGVLYTGVSTNKNVLGFVLMVCGLALVWRLYRKWGSESGTRLDNIGIPVMLLLMVGWLFGMANSKTSLICLLIGGVIFFTLRLPSIRRSFLTYLSIGLLVFIVLQSTMNITGVIIASAGRDETLTGRTELWEVVLSMQQHPIGGFGFDSFWLGDRLQRLQDRWYFKPNQAHSGYIDLYLNLGWAGGVFLGGVILSCYWKLRKLLTSGSSMNDWVIFGRLGTAYLVGYLLYNYTEAAFKSPHLLWFFFLLFAMHDVSRRMVRDTPSMAVSSNNKKLRMTGFSALHSFR